MNDIDIEMMNLPRRELLPSRERPLEARGAPGDEAMHVPPPSRRCFCVPPSATILSLGWFHGQERFERIAAARRRQKEQHRRFLASLKAKRQREEASQPSPEGEKSCLSLAPFGARAGSGNASHERGKVSYRRKKKAPCLASSGPCTSAVVVVFPCCRSGGVSEGEIRSYTQASLILLKNRHRLNHH